MERLYEVIHECINGAQGSAVGDQFLAVMQGESLEDQNPNALEYIKRELKSFRRCMEDLLNREGLEFLERIENEFNN